jgi:outer membrane protein, heavy metal efflux system
VEVDSARIGLDTVRVAIRSIEGQVKQTRAALAAAIGVPVSALKDVMFDPADADRLPPPAALQPATLQHAGLLNRLDVQQLLAEYAAAEAGLQLEVAKQYPDVHLGPGYQWDQGVNKYAIGLSVELPILNQNQGPIAEAQARRKEIAARFLALQATVIGQTEQAVTRYQAAMAELAEADRLLAVQRQRLRTVQRSLEAGEADRLALASARVESATVARSRLDALRKAQAALGALEDAVQRPLDSQRTQPFVLPPAPRNDQQEETKP